MSSSKQTLQKLSVDRQMLESYDGPIPRHIGVIMDGNGRWATTRGLARIKGHHEGAKSVRTIVEAARFLGVEVLTLYAFSSQNWGRPEDEVRGLMMLFDLYIKREKERLIANNVAIKCIGDIARLPQNLQKSIRKIESDTAAGAQMTLQVAVSYGGREEIVAAVRNIARQVEEGSLDADAISEVEISKALYTANLPDPDLVIRTSGEMRISNFLLWQIAYSELFVTDVLWPDFSEEHLVQALQAFGGRERRYGKTSAQVQ